MLGKIIISISFILSVYLRLVCAVQPIEGIVDCNTIINKVFPNALSGEDVLLDGNGKKVNVESMTFLKWAKCYDLDKYRKLFKPLLKLSVKIMGHNLGTAFKAMDETTDMLIIGGAIRDILSGRGVEKIKDVDVGFGNFKTALARCSSLGWRCLNHSESTYIEFGDGDVIEGFQEVNEQILSKMDPMEGKSYVGTLNKKKCDIENSVNGLVWSPKAGILIYLTGIGLNDVAQHKISVTCDNPKDWMAHSNFRALRVLKMIAKGFTLTDEYIDFWYKTLNIYMEGDTKWGTPEVTITFLVCKKNLMNKVTLTMIQDSIRKVKMTGNMEKLKKILLGINCETKGKP
jgi:hypothetical protein